MIGGLELLTPPLALDEADLVRSELVDAIYELDGDFNFFPNEFTEDCGWHINVDAGDLRLDPEQFILGVDELLLLAANERLFSRYTATQRHAVGSHLLRHLVHDPSAKLLRASALDNLLCDRAGRYKGYAANFSKLIKGYVELRHFSADGFFNGPGLEKQLERIPLAFELWPSQTRSQDQVFLRKFELLSRWLKRHRSLLSWNLHPGLIVAEGRVHFAGEPLSQLVSNGLCEINIFGEEEHDYIATIRDLDLPDIEEGVALLALDLAELHNLGVHRGACVNKHFHKAVLALAANLRKEPALASIDQLNFLEQARAARRKVGR